MIDKRTLADQVRSYILDLIKNHRLAPGMEVPSEMRVIQDLGVSRGVVREAFRSLAALGVLEIASGKRPRIQAVKPDAMETIFSYALATEQVTPAHVLELRRALEIGSAALASRNGTEEDFSALRIQMEQIRTVFGDHERFIEHDVAFHTILAVATKNPMYAMQIQALRAPLETSIRAGLYDERIKRQGALIIDLHQKITDAVCSRNEEKAISAMAAHFDSAVAGLLEKGECTSKPSPIS